MTSVPAQTIEDIQVAPTRFKLAGQDNYGREVIFFQAQESQQPIFDLIFKNPILDHVMTILIGGALGGGKTKTLVAAFLSMALFYPGSRIYVCRKDFADLRDTLYKDFAEICPSSIIARPKGSLLERVEAAHDVLLSNGSLIMFRELKDLTGKFGLEVNMVIIEQVEEVDESIFKAMISRLRPWMKAPKNSPYLLLAAANPCNTWVKTTWIDEKRPYHYYFHLSPRKNHALLAIQPNYIKDLEARFDASWVRKYIDGDWSATVEGAVFIEFDTKKHVIEPFEIPPFWPRYMSLDPHLSKPFYALYAAQAPNGPLFFFHEMIGKQFQKSSDFFDNLIKEEMKVAPRGASRVIDYSLASVMHEKNNGSTLWNVIEQTGLNFKNARKSNKTKSLLRIKEELAADPCMIYFFNTVPVTIKQISNYRVNPDTEKILKQEDHQVDNFEYIMNETPWIEPGKIIQYNERPTYYRDLKLA